MTLPPPIITGQPYTALAPMQDVTDLPFMQVIGGFGPPDFFFTEYFRVHEHSTLERHILESITDHGTSRPVFAQLIGENLDYMERAARQLQEYPIAGVDLNMGCPAPKVYRKNVGGGLLREVAKVDALLERMRSACAGRFTVKMRIGFDSTETFSDVLECISRHRVDLLSVHGRTVKEMYRSEVHYEKIAEAKAGVPCPVLANGNITSAAKAATVIRETHCDGVMIGRSAIRNPWIFRQCREYFANTSIYRPTLGDVREYIDLLWHAMNRPQLPDYNRLSRMKKFLNFVGQGVDPDGAFLHDMRRATHADDFFALCDAHLRHNGKSEQLFSDEPFAGIVARPNQETYCGCS